ncbi:DUF4275 family protein [Inhella proteolytica]|uniref:DUF4275 family protein n=1 Tax=Inhella proteolytica TaxID=2795029 RepID=A0A931J1L2_9BURK|nr:DUF4275 family protein [Inhella proteolytica]MBH9577043.1 DUF4275 family protein [Inhella proteolytica]
MSRRECPPIPEVALIRAYSPAEAAQWAQDWLAVYGKDRQGMNTKDFLWHVFSGGRYPSLSGAEAMSTYRQQTGVEFVVLANDRKQALLLSQPPQGPPWSDCYVFPPNLAWTLAFTHEAGWLGPYFARHPDFAALNHANQLKLQKRLEAERARAKGWC